MPVYIGQKAPDLTFNTSQGPKSFADYKGKWLLLFSHPGDFTPVCTTEFVDFAENYDEFKSLGVELMGLSVDTIYSHIAWLKDIKDNLDVEIPFPIIADVDKDVAEAFNLMDRKIGATVRGVFLVDPNQVVRWMVYYPAEVGRNMKEILRVIKAFQFNWDKKLATPVNWEPGDAGIVSAPSTFKDALTREKEEGAQRWYLKRVKA